MAANITHGHTTLVKPLHQGAGGGDLIDGVVLEIEGFGEGRHNGMVGAIARAGAMGLQGSPQTGWQAQMEAVNGIGMVGHGAGGNQAIEWEIGFEANEGHPEAIDQAGSMLRGAATKTRGSPGLAGMGPPCLKMARVKHFTFKLSAPICQSLTFNFNLQFQAAYLNP